VGEKSIILYKRASRTVMGRKAKYFTATERKAARAKRQRDDPKQKEYQKEYRKRKQEQRRLQQHPDPLSLLANDETQNRMREELKAGVVVPRTHSLQFEESEITEVYVGGEDEQGINDQNCSF
jgi:hypothetical protein